MDRGLVGLILVGGVIAVVASLIYALVWILRFIVSIVGITLISMLWGSLAGLAALAMEALVVGWVWLYRRKQLLDALDGRDLESIVGVSVQGGSLRWDIREDAAAQVLPAVRWERWSLAASVVGAGVVFIVLRRYGVLSGVEVLEMQAPLLLVVAIASLTAAAISGAGTYLLKWLEPTERLWQQATAYAGTKLQQANSACEQGLQALRRTEEELQALARGFGFELETDYGEQLRHNMGQGQGAQGRSAIEQLTAAVNAAQAAALQDKTTLTVAFQGYQSAQQSLHAAEQAVRATGSKLLLDRLEELHEGLVQDAPELLPMRKWEDFRDIVAAIRSELETLRLDAEAFAGGGTGPASDGGPMSVERALRILNVPPNASAEQIKKVFKAMAMAWHTDHGGDDEQMKNLNLAMACLKQAGRV